MSEAAWERKQTMDALVELQANIAAFHAAVVNLKHAAGHSSISEDVVEVAPQVVEDAERLDERLRREVDLQDWIDHLDQLASEG